MKLISNKINGVFEIDLNPLKDDRGFFMRTFDLEFFKDHGLNFQWVQENHSRTVKTSVSGGCISSFHRFQRQKMIRCVRGAILDVFVDLRKNSSTFGQWGSIELSEENKKMVIVPQGFAHGFCTLSEITDVLYKVDNVYSPKHESGILWNDPDLNISWPVQEPILSEKDANNPGFNSFVKKHGGIEVSR